MSEEPEYKRVLLKVSGEALMGDGQYGIDVATVDRIASEVKDALSLGVEVCMVIGGGNIFRGLSGAADGMDRASADYMGMLATIMNALAMQNGLERLGVPTRVLSAIPMTSVCEPYIRRRAIRHMEKARVVIFAAGTGNPFFTTDTAAALRAAEMGCDALMKGTNVDGVYSADPKTDPLAERFDRLSYIDVLTKDLKVMDASAVSLSRENGIPIVVFSIQTSGGFMKFCGVLAKAPSFVIRLMGLGRRKMSIDLDDIERRMEGAVATLKADLGGLRTGRASASLLEPVMVEAYGQQMPIAQVGTISVPEPRMLSVQVWDKGQVALVEKAIREAGLGLNPMADGQLVRIPLPELNEERREELVKVAGRYAEQARVAVRNVRRDGMDQIKKSEKDGDMSQDDAKLFSNEMQETTDRYVKLIDETLEVKEGEIRQV